MKPRRSGTIASLLPAPDGWRLREGDQEVAGSDVGGLCGELSSGVRVEVLLPSAALVLERFQLPEAPREDLVAMAQLQLEKLLPYASEEFVFDLQEIGKHGEDQVEVLALSVSMAALDACCGPLRRNGRGPVRLGVYANQLAMGLAGEPGVVLMVWMEFERPFVALVEKGRLLWMEGLPSVDAALAELEISRALIGAELSGVGVEISRAVVAVQIPGWIQAVSKVVPGIPVEERGLEAATEIEGSWMPALWIEEEATRSRGVFLWERLQWVGLAYLLVLTLAFGWLALQKAGLKRLDAQLAQLQPEVEASKASQNRWIQLQPAADPGRFMVEILNSIQSAVGPADVKITEFKMGVREFSISGEASSLAEAIEYSSRLKKDPALFGFQLQSPNPNILPNERAQFRITAKSESVAPSPRR